MDHAKLVRAQIETRKFDRVAHPLQSHRKGWVIERSETVLSTIANTATPPLLQPRTTIVISTEAVHSFINRTDLPF